MFTAAVITVSTGIAVGKRPDTSGRILRDGLARMGLSVIDAGVISDDCLRIQQTVLRYCDFEPVSVLVLTGGTGPTPDDVTPQAALPLLERRYEGIEAAVQEVGRSTTRRASMSRLLVGARGLTVVITLPGSPGACEDALKVLEPLLTHLLSLTAGISDPH